jgi:hypothetical protein
LIKRIIKGLIRQLGYDLVPHREEPPFPIDFDPQAIAIIDAVKSYTMTSHERIFALIQAVRYVVKAGIPGSIVECGVWRGGGMMAVALTLEQLGVRDVDLFLFDTFEGMTKPAQMDIDCAGVAAEREFARTRRRDHSSDWCRSPIDEVESNLHSTGYPRERIKLVKGQVEQTIPDQAPSQVSLLRLDTDWYQSTRHELVHLYPRLIRGGVLIIDDYGHWQGSRKATDEYFLNCGVPILLNRIDYTGRISVKCDSDRPV